MPSIRPRGGGGSGKPWVKGQSGNPSGLPGKPKGAKDKIKRGTIKAIWNDILTNHPEKIRDVLMAGIEQGLAKRRANGTGLNKARPNLALPFIELGAKLNKELGLDPMGIGASPVIINWHSNVNPQLLRVQPATPALPEGEEQSSESDEEGYDEP